MVRNFTRKVDFFETKDGMVESTLDNINKYNASRLKVRYIRLNNAGENKKLKSEIKISD